MGVHGFTSFISSSSSSSSLSTILSLPPPPPPSYPSPPIPFILDGPALLYHLGLPSSALRGGDYTTHLRREVRRYVGYWRECGLVPEVVWDGPYPPSKFPTILLRSTQSLVHSLTYMRTSPSKLSSTHPSCAQITKKALRMPLLSQFAVVEELKALGVGQYWAEGEADSATAELAMRRGGIVGSNDSDYFIFPTEAPYAPLSSITYGPSFLPRLPSSSSSPSSTPPSMQLTLYSHTCIARSLNLPPGRLPALAALLGNDRYSLFQPQPPPQARARAQSTTSGEAGGSLRVGGPSPSPSSSSSNPSASGRNLPRPPHPNPNPNPNPTRHGNGKKRSRPSLSPSASHPPHPHPQQRKAKPYHGRLTSSQTLHIARLLSSVPESYDTGQALGAVWPLLLGLKVQHPPSPSSGADGDGDAEEQERRREEIQRALEDSARSYELIGLEDPRGGVMSQFPLRDSSAITTSSDETNANANNSNKERCRHLLLSAFHRGELSNLPLTLLSLSLSRSLSGSDSDSASGPGSGEWGGGGTAECSPPGALEIPEKQSPSVSVGRGLRVWMYALLDDSVGFLGGGGGGGGEGGVGGEGQVERDGDGDGNGDANARARGRRTVKEWVRRQDHLYPAEVYVPPLSELIARSHSHSHSPTSATPLPIPIPILLQPLSNRFTILLLALRWPSSLPPPPPSPSPSPERSFLPLLLALRWVIYSLPKSPWGWTYPGTGRGPVWAALTTAVLLQEEEEGNQGGLSLLPNSNHQALSEESGCGERWGVEVPEKEHIQRSVELLQGLYYVRILAEVLLLVNTSPSPSAEDEGPGISIGDVSRYFEGTIFHQLLALAEESSGVGVRGGGGGGEWDKWWSAMPARVRDQVERLEEVLWASVEA